MIKWSLKEFFITVLFLEFKQILIHLVEFCNQNIWSLSGNWAGSTIVAFVPDISMIFFIIKITKFFHRRSVTSEVKRVSSTWKFVSASWTRRGWTLYDLAMWEGFGQALSNENKIFGAVEFDGASCLSHLSPHSRTTALLKCGISFIIVERILSRSLTGGGGVEDHSCSESMIWFGLTSRSDSSGSTSFVFKGSLH